MIVSTPTEWSRPGTLRSFQDNQLVVELASGASITVAVASWFTSEPGDPPFNEMFIQERIGQAVVLEVNELDRTFMVSEPGQELDGAAGEYKVIQHG